MGRSVGVSRCVSWGRGKDGEGESRMGIYITRRVLRTLCLLQHGWGLPVDGL